MLSYDKSGITQGLVYINRFLLHAFVQYVFGRYCLKIQIWVPSQTIYLYVLYISIRKQIQYILLQEDCREHIIALHVKGLKGL